MHRRDFLKTLALAGAGTPLAAEALASGTPTGNAAGAQAVLVDTTYCVGCRKCEWACQDANTEPKQDLHEVRNAIEMGAPRRPDAGTFTVVNAQPGADPDPEFVKVQCMHCLDPACASACLVGALRKEERGPVSYDAGRCIGCRYCMVACPFQIPAYEYADPLTPRVMKCSFCLERTADGERPACVSICPEGALKYGKRGELIAYAHKRIGEYPDRYHDHVYGEKEVGGTSWLYLSAVPLTALGFPELPENSPARGTERVQHALFKHFIPPLALFAVLGGIMKLNREAESAE